MTPAELAARIHAFERELERRCASRTQPTTFGTAFLNPDFPLRYDSNFVWVDRRLDGVDADSLAADADRILGELGFAHRKVTVDDDAQGRRLARAFLDLGWSAERLVIMARQREAEARPAADVAGVRELGFDEARPALEEVQRRQPDVEDDETLRQLTEIRAVLEREAGASFFVAESAGRPASVCELYAIDGVAQIEDVNTLDEFRGRGLGSAVVLAAARSARARGCDVVFLIADDADWPKELYERLGFDAVSRRWSFVSSPAEPGRPAAPSRR
ncbi:MAG: GNAT family N-acetyltransferase [Actinomycetota bacterium]